MSEFLQWFTGLATISGFAYFMLGFSVSYIFWWWRCKIKHRKMRLPWNYIGITIGILVMIVTSLQSSEAYNTARHVAEQQKECNIEFRSAIVDRAAIGKENDELSQEQRSIVFYWFHDILFPPAPWSTMSVDDPNRQQYVLNRTIQTEDVFSKSLKRQDQVQAERDKHKYPDPTCGK